MPINEPNSIFVKLLELIPQNEIQALFSKIEQVQLNANDIYITSGSAEKKIGYIKSGIIKAVITDDLDNEKVCLLRWEGQFIGTLNRPARFIFKAVEPTIILQLRYEVIEDILIQYPRLNKFFNDILLMYLAESLEHLESFVLLRPEERYMEFLKAKPDIQNRVPDKYIANVLGITPESLSRIRKRISKK